MSKEFFNRIAAICFMGLGVFFAIGSRGISSSSYGSNVGPGVFPFGLGVILIVLSVLLLLETFRGKKKTAAADAEPTAEKPKTRVGFKHISPGYKRMGLVILSLIIYISVFVPLGYVISTFLFLSAMFFLLEPERTRKNIIKILTIALVFSAGVYYVYVYQFMGNLPSGPSWLPF